MSFDLCKCGFREGFFGISNCNRDFFSFFDRRFCFEYPKEFPKMPGCLELSDFRSHALDKSSCGPTGKDDLYDRHFPLMGQCFSWKSDEFLSLCCLPPWSTTSSDWSSSTISKFYLQRWGRTFRCTVSTPAGQWNFRWKWKYCWHITPLSTWQHWPHGILLPMLTGFLGHPLGHELCGWIEPPVDSLWAVLWWS